MDDLLPGKHYLRKKEINRRTNAHRKRIFVLNLLVVGFGDIREGRLCASSRTFGGASCFCGDARNDVEETDVWVTVVSDIVFLFGETVHSSNHNVSESDGL